MEVLIQDFEEFCGIFCVEDRTYWQFFSNFAGLWPISSKALRWKLVSLSNCGLATIRGSVGPLVHLADSTSCKVGIRAF